MEPEKLLDEQSHASDKDPRVGMGKDKWMSEAYMIAGDTEKATATTPPVKLGRDKEKRELPSNSYSMPSEMICLLPVDTVEGGDDVETEQTTVDCSFGHRAAHLSLSSCWDLRWAGLLYRSRQGQRPS